MPKNLTAWTADFDSVKRSPLDLSARRLIHRAHLRQLNHRPVDDGTAIVHRWMEENDSDAMLVGLRRILDDARGSFSLVRLIKEID